MINENHVVIMIKYKMIAMYLAREWLRWIGIEISVRNAELK